MAITLVRTVMTCIACPSQWDAWDADGNYYYLRYRHGYGKVVRYSGPDWYHGDETGELIADFAHGDHLDGSISLDEFAERAGLILAGGAVRTAFGDHIAEQLVYDGVPLDIAEIMTQPWRDAEDENGEIG